jgi:hypothetical protein
VLLLRVPEKFPQVFKTWVAEVINIRNVFPVEGDNGCCPMGSAYVNRDNECVQSENVTCGCASTPPVCCLFVAEASVYGVSVMFIDQECVNLCAAAALCSSRPAQPPKVVITVGKEPKVTVDHLIIYPCCWVEGLESLDHYHWKRRG